jgi:hypothetical protein
MVESKKRPDFSELLVNSPRRQARRRGRAGSAAVLAFISCRYRKLGMLGGGPERRSETTAPGIGKRRLCGCVHAQRRRPN